MPLRTLVLAGLALGLAPSVAAQARLGVAQADAFVLTVYTREDAEQYSLAADAYLRLVAALDSTVTPVEERILLALLHRLAPIVPDEERAAWGLDVALSSGRLASLSGDAGAQIRRWWRLQDDLPATPMNERLQEHLARTVLALQSFADDRDPAGFDDRGDVYVRFGPPDRAFEISVSPSIAAFDLEVPRAWTRIPANELWIYPSVRRGLHYLFVQPSARRPYQLARSVDLMPPSLLSAAQGRGRVDALLVVMEEVYGQLALRDQAYGATLDAVAGMIGGGTAAASPPTQRAQSLLRRARAEDVAIVGARTTLAPVSRSSTRRGTTPLEADLRLARFREPDGSTRLEVVWGLADATRLEPSRALATRLAREGVAVSPGTWVSLSAVLLDDAPARHAHRFVEAGTRGAVVESVELPLRSASRVAVQWQGRVSERADGASRPGPRVTLGTRSLEAAAPLPASGFAVSDLQPLVRVEEGASARPYPFAAVPSSGVVLSFEVYGLARDTTGRSRVRIEVGVAAPEAAEETLSSSAFETDEAVVRELLELDVAPYVRTGAVVTVRVTDERSGASAERTLVFEAP